MIFASDKNFPKFIHNDTLIKTISQPSLDVNENLNKNSFFILPRFFKQSQNKSALKKIKPLDCSYNANNFSKSNENQPSKIISSCFAYKFQQEPSQKNTILLKTKHLPKIAINNENKSFDERLAIKSLNFQKYMNYHKEKSFMNNNENSFFQNISKKIKSHHKLKKNVTVQERSKTIVVKDEKNPLICKQSFLMTSFPDSSFLNLQQHKLDRKSTALISSSDMKMIRTLTIPNYKDLLIVLKKLEKNLRDYSNCFGYNERSAKILKILLSEKIKMNHLFFSGGNGKLIQPFCSFYLEEQCIKKEKVLENGKFINKNKIDLVMISELNILTEKLEEINNSKYIEDLKNTRDSLLMEYQKLKEIEKNKPWNMKRNDFDLMPKFNFEIMPNIHFMREMDEFERQYGACDLIGKKSKMIGRVLEDILGEIKKTTSSSSNHYFP